MSTTPEVKSNDPKKALSGLKAKLLLIKEEKAVIKTLKLQKNRLLFEIGALVRLRDSIQRDALAFHSPATGRPILLRLN